MRVLLTCIGSNDPYSVDDDGKKIPGPILTLLEEQKYDRVFLLWGLDNDFNIRAGQTAGEIRRLYTATDVENKSFDCKDPTDYYILMKEMKAICLDIRKHFSSESATYVIQVSSGTPQMQVVWLSLVQSGVINATVYALHPRYRPEYSRPYAYEIVLEETGVHNSVEMDELRSQLNEAKSEISRLKLESTAAGLNAVLPGGVDICDLPHGFDLLEYVKSEKRRLIAAAVALHPDNSAQAARLLGMNPHTLRKEADNLGIKQRSQKT